jgi:hypothetical protein
MARRRPRKDWAARLRARWPDLEYWDPARAVPEAAVAPGPAAAEPALESPHPSGVLTASPDHLQAKEELKARFGGFARLAERAAAGLRAYASWAHELDLDNIQGWAVGAKSTGGRYTGDLAIKVYVRRKAPGAHVAREAKVPARVAGFPTDVVEVGVIRAGAFTGFRPRPVPCGSAIGSQNVTEGTLGCLVRLADNKLCLLSNNHILADLNRGRSGVDPIIQPGPNEFVGTDVTVDQALDSAVYRIGVLWNYVELLLNDPTAENVVDAAVAWTAPDLVEPQFPDLVTIQPTPMVPAVYQTVTKFGFASQRTCGDIIDIDADFRAYYSTGDSAVFRHQFMVRSINSRPFSIPGDSGSIILTVGTHQPVGLLLGGDAAGNTYVNPIGAVMRALNIPLDGFIGVFGSSS